jgi:site-specific DNA-methyltransferase (adenine-specific)
MTSQEDKRFTRDGVTLNNADALQLYNEWENPVVIVSDGAYGISGFAGDPPKAEKLPDWYEAHIKAWSKKATPQTTLWFWNREIGWAYVHPVLNKYGWNYVSANIWDKGIAHAAGDSNIKMLRRFPQVTEVCVQYVRRADFEVESKIVGMQEWFRHEWDRTGLPQWKANEASGVKNAATRKYLTKDHLFYYPPPKRFEMIVEYANKYGDPNGHPYFSVDGKKPLSGKEWAMMRSKFHCVAGVTNVWRHPPLHNEERLKQNGKVGKAIHLNQKPLKLMELIIRASSDEGDVVWEPFGGLCSAAIASHTLRRKCLSAETDSKLFEVAVHRLRNYDKPKAEGNRTNGLETFLSMEQGQRDN